MQRLVQAAVCVLHLEFRATHQGVQRRETPLLCFYPPRMGARGLKTNSFHGHLETRPGFPPARE
jgi:hypothetical protein